MSLEKAILDLTTAVRELNDTLNNSAGAATPAAKPAATKPAAGKPATPAKKAPTPPAEETEEETEEGEVDRAALTKDLIAFGKAHGREAALKILGKFKATNLTGVPDEKLPEFARLLEQAKAELEG